MWILNVKFNASTWNFLSLAILTAIFNVSVLGFSMYFYFTKNKDLYFIYYFIFFVLTTKVSIKTKTESGNCFCIRVV